MHDYALVLNVCHMNINVLNRDMLIDQQMAVINRTFHGSERYD